MTPATHILWCAAGKPPGEGNTTGVCRVCGHEGMGLPFDRWVRDTFTNYNLLTRGDIICQWCQFAFAQSCPVLTAKVNKDKPQRMQNYSHIVSGGVWHPLTKGQKPQIRDLLLQSPELAVIAESGQKHLVFRATPGWIQFEEQAIPMHPQSLREHMHIVDSLYQHFSKDEIQTGRYASWKIKQCGVEVFTTLEGNASGMRGSLMFDLAVFLAHRDETEVSGEETNGKPTRVERTDSQRVTRSDMEGDRPVVQVELPF